MSDHRVLDGRAIAQQMKVELCHELDALRRHLRLQGLDIDALGVAHPQLGVLYFGTQASMLYWFAQQKVALVRKFPAAPIPALAPCAL